MSKISDKFWTIGTNLLYNLKEISSNPLNELFNTSKGDFWI